MTDRELLELAAKAAGYKKYYAHYLGRDSFVTYDEEYYSEVKERRVVGEKTLDWNPLADDGDALRLVKARHMTVAWEPSRGGWSVGAIVSGEFRWLVFDEDCNRAIVRAAAEIGRSKE